MSCGSSLSSCAVSTRTTCSMACGLRNSSRRPPATSRTPSRPLSTRPTLKVLSSAGDSGLAGAPALAVGVVIGTDSPLGSGKRVGSAGTQVTPAGDGMAPGMARGDQGRADHQGSGQRAQARGEADQAEGAYEDRAARIADLTPGLGRSHGPPQLSRWRGRGQAGEADGSSGGDARPDEHRTGDHAPQARGGADEPAPARGPRGGGGRPGGGPAPVPPPAKRLDTPAP